jgi:hypothetical protein
MDRIDSVTAAVEAAFAGAGYQVPEIRTAEPSDGAERVG